jgi:hypothetical protein
MGGSRFLQVESKSFEIVKHVSTLSIIERSRSHVSSVSMGFLAARWCREALLEVANLTTEKHLFRSFRERNSVFVIQKQRNGRGGFVSITVLGESRGKGIVFIPEGRDGKGWRGVSNVIHDLLTPMVPEKQVSNPRQPPTVMEQRSQLSNTHGESRTFKEAVIRGDTIPNIIPNISHVMEGNTSVMRDSGKAVVNDSVELFLKVILGVGPGEKWVVKWAGVMDQPSGAMVSFEDQMGRKTNVTGPIEGGPSVQADVRTGPNVVVSSEATQKPNTNKPVKPIINKPDPVHKLVWRPRTSGSQKSPTAVESGSRVKNDFPGADHVSVHGCDSESQCSSRSSLVPASPLEVQPIAEVLKGIGEVDRTWGSSSEWFIDLRDGRRLRLPMDLRGTAVEAEVETTQKLIQWVSSHRDVIIGENGESDWGTEGLDSMSTISGSEPKDETHDFFVGSAPEGDTVTMEGVMVTTEGLEVTEPLSVVPLAMIPVELEETNEEVYGGEKAVVLGTMEVMDVGSVGLETSGVEERSYVGEMPSDWVLRQQKRVGKVLGASYVGSEHAVTKLLMDIEARHQQRKAGQIGEVRPASSGRKGCRELKGLVSSVNYEARISREAKGKGKAQGGDVVVY